VTERVHWNDWASRASLVILPLLFAGMVQLLVWVVELRANRYTKDDHAEHLGFHALGTSISPSREVLDKLDRIDQRFDLVDERLVELSSRRE
jgi:hypothetical protein